MGWGHKRWGLVSNMPFHLSFQIYFASNDFLHLFSCFLSISNLFMHLILIPLSQGFLMPVILSFYFYWLALFFFSSHSFLLLFLLSLPSTDLIHVYYIKLHGIIIQIFYNLLPSPFPKLLYFFLWGTQVTWFWSI